MQFVQFDRTTDQPRSRSVGVFTDYAVTMNRLYVAGRRRALRLKRAGYGPDHEQRAEQRWDGEGGGSKR
jgi:hypothetical protein